MRLVLGFCSMLALGLMAAAGIAFVVSGAGKNASESLVGPPGFALDYVSLLLGLALGVAIGTLARISWSELPRRIVSWLIFNERNLHRFAWGGLFLAVVLFY